VSGIPGIGKSERKSNLSRRPLFEFVSLLYVYEQIVSPDVKRHRYDELKNLVNVRMLKHQDYFHNQGILQASYGFLKKVVDFLA